MKQLFILFIAIVTIALISCSKEKLDKTNTDPTKAGAANFDPNYLLSNAQLTYANTGYSQVLYQGPMMQVIASTISYYGNGDKYVNADSFLDYQGKLWNDGYNAFSTIKEMQLLANQKGAENYSNLISIGDIMLVLITQRLTDTYGDVPYSQAGQAKSGIRYPAYDTQQNIYLGMLNNLQSAINKLDPAKDIPAQDLFYSRFSGAARINAWKKFGYSLMLRVAMRLTKADAPTAKIWAEKAALGGTFIDINDNAIVYTDASNGNVQNSTSNVMQVDLSPGFKWSKTFIDRIKADNDPRLSYIAELSNNNNNPAVQIGMPNGRDLNGGATDIRNEPAYPGAAGTEISGNYSRPRTSVYMPLNTPILVLTYAETELLLAEAAARGWNVGSATASVHYSNGVRGSLKSLGQINSVAEIPDGTINTYVAGKPLDVSSLGNSLRDINIQYWVSTASTFNFIETWHNWKRSGYPVLTPVNYTGNVTGSTIPRRLPYPSNEIIITPDAYRAAVARLSGGDVLTGRVWWDQ